MQPPVLCARCDDDRTRLIAAALADDRFERAVANLQHGVHVDLRAESHGLLQHPLSKLVAGNFRKAGVVFQLGREGDLAAEGIALQHQHRFSCAARINRRRQAGRTRADNKNIITHISCPLPQQRRGCWRGSPRAPSRPRRQE